MDYTLSPLERVHKIWYAVFIIRIWRNYIVSREDLSLKENFLTLNCYVCIELNAHSLILLLLHLKQTNSSNFFLPHLFGSQQCESLFRQIRSFTSTYSTVANCSVKEILSRVSKIQLQSEISFKYNCFKFPRLGHNHLKIIKSEMPSQEEISSQIEKCMEDAIHDAVQIGLLEKGDATHKSTLKCKIKPYVPNASSRKQFSNSNASCRRTEKQLPLLSNITLKNFADKFGNKNIAENSPYTEVFGSKIRRIIVKKTSLCWLLREESQKLSTDRLRRVQTSVRENRPKTLHFNLYTNKNHKKFK